MNDKEWIQTENGMMSLQSVNAGYNPIDDTSNTGYRRPPRIAGCVLDYFKAIGCVEDGGYFAHTEAELMIQHPEVFFAKK